MSDIAEALIFIFSKYLGINIPEWTIPFLVMSFFLTPIVVSSVLAYRLFRDYVKTVSARLSETNDFIVNNLHTVAARLDQKLSDIHSSIKLTNEVEAGGEDPDVSVEAVAPPNRGFKLKTAQDVAKIAQDKWLEGFQFKRFPNDGGCFTFRGKSEGELEIKINLLTPYRSQIGMDGRMPYAVDLWVDGRKHLNFEWDTAGQYAVRGFRKGDWIEDVLNWRFKGDLSVSQNRAAVA
jgi:hypothetical protein